MSKQKFSKGQVVCIRGLQMPHGCALLIAPLDSKRLSWLGFVEQDGEIVEREFTEGSLRPLNRREAGKQ